MKITSNIIMARIGKMVPQPNVLGVFCYKVVLNRIGGFEYELFYVKVAARPPLVSPQS